MGAHTHTHSDLVRRMDDLAVDSDEEVDYSKMDQVSPVPLAPPPLAQGAVT